MCVASRFFWLLLNLVFVIPGVIERWELIQAQALSKELRMKQNLQQWQQFNSDLNSIWAWLGETEEELEKLHRLDLSTDIQTIELRIKKLKVSFTALFHELPCKTECNRYVIEVANNCVWFAPHSRLLLIK